MTLLEMLLGRRLNQQPQEPVLPPTPAPVPPDVPMANEIPLTDNPNPMLESAANTGEKPANPLLLALANRMAKFNFIRNARNRNQLATKQLDQL